MHEFATICPRSPSSPSGHEFWAPGVYVTRRFETAREYARPHQLFSDGTFYRCVVKVGAEQMSGELFARLQNEPATNTGDYCLWIRTSGDLGEQILNSMTNIDYQ